MVQCSIRQVMSTPRVHEHQRDECGLALFVAGAAVARFTERSPLYSGLRQLTLGGFAAAVPAWSANSSSSTW